MNDDALRAIEAEKAVLGAALTDPAAADACLPILRPEAFARLPHERIWASIAALRAKGAGCDPIAVGDDLQKRGLLESVDGYPYLSDLMAAIPATANAADHARIVQTAHLRRRIIAAAQEAIEAAQDARVDAAGLATAVDQSLRAVADVAAAGDEPVRLSDLVNTAFQFVDALYEGRAEPGIGTGLPLLDRNTNGGLHCGELVVLGAPPSTGKSALAEALALHIAAGARTVLYATPEMTDLMVALRALALLSGVDLRRLWGSPRMRETDWSALSHAMGRLSDQGRTFWIDSTSTTWDAIAAHARRLHAREPLTLLVVDHLHELEWPRGADTENRAIGEIVAGCKRLAKSLGISVLLLSQLNRAARQEKREPALHDLRGSGAIEQHADLVLLLHPHDAGEGIRETPLDVIIAKQRNGRTGTLRLLHDRTTGRFRDPNEGREDSRVGRDAS